MNKLVVAGVALVAVAGVGQYVMTRGTSAPKAEVVETIKPAPKAVKHSPRKVKKQPVRRGGKRATKIDCTDVHEFLATHTEAEGRALAPLASAAQIRHAKACINK